MSYEEQQQRDAHERELYYQRQSNQELEDRRNGTGGGNGCLILVASILGSLVVGGTAAYGALTKKAAPDYSVTGATAEAVIVEQVKSPQR